MWRLRVQFSLSLCCFFFFILLLLYFYFFYFFCFCFFLGGEGYSRHRCRLVSPPPFFFVFRAQEVPTGPGGAYASGEGV